MFGIYAQRARRRRRVVSRTSRPRFAACVLPGLLLIASIAPGSALAGAAVTPVHPHDTTATTPASSSAGGGTTMATAAQLENELHYRGTVVTGQQLWYKFDSAGERAYVEVRGETPLCSVRAALLDARGRTLGRIVSSTRETLPLLVYFPTHPVSEEYYLRIDANPYAACASTSYVFKLVEPEQPRPDECGSDTGPLPTGPHGEPIPKSCTAPSKESAVPAFEARACQSGRSTFDHANKEVTRVRALVARRRASIRTLRQLEREQNRDLRKMNVRCLL